MLTLRLTLRRGTVLAVLMLFAGAAAQAVPVLLQDFEGALPVNTGDVGTDDGTLASAPPEGSQQALMTTYSLANDPPGGEFVPNGAVPVSPTLAGFTDVAASSFPVGSNEGSAIRWTFTHDAGDTVMFDYNFLTNVDLVQANPENDFAFFTAQLGFDTPVLDIFESIDTSTLGNAVNPALFNDETGVDTYMWVVPTSGSYTFTIGVVDATTFGGGSGLAVDNIRYEPIPEPSTVAMIAGAGVLALALWRRRR